MIDEYLEALGLQEGASQEEIQAAYDKLSKELDPANKDNQEFFVEEFKILQEAYKALSNSSILATEKGAKSLKKIQPKSNDKESINPKNTPEKKPSKKSSFIIDWIFIILGGILFGNLFSFLISVYYFKVETIESFFKMDFKTILSLNKNSSLLISAIFANFLIGFFIFIILMGLIKRIFKLNSKKLLRLNSKKLLRYIGKRKKNTTLLILIIPILKVILHYSFYPYMFGGEPSYRRVSSRSEVYTKECRQTLAKHIDVLFEDELNLFIVATGIVLFVAWFFNDKIKAR